MYSVLLRTSHHNKWYHLSLEHQLETAQKILCVFLLSAVTFLLPFGGHDLEMLPLRYQPRRWTHGKFPSRTSPTSKCTLGQPAKTVNEQAPAFTGMQLPVNLHKLQDEFDLISYSLTWLVILLLVIGLRREKSRLILARLRSVWDHGDST